MTVTQAPTVPFGRHLGVAARGARALLDEVLAREAMTYETWIALNLLSAPGPRPATTDLARSLAAALELGDAAVAQLLGQLEAFGLIASGPGVEPDLPVITLTDDGEAQIRRVLAAVNLASGQALHGLEPAEVQTAVRVLQHFAERTAGSRAG